MKYTTTRKLVMIGILGAIAGLLMLPAFPIIAIAPNFYELDLSEVAVVVGTFSLGPLAGVAIEFIKILINVIANGSKTAFVGEFAAFTIGVAFILPAGFIYRSFKTKKGALIALLIGSVSMVVFASLLNYFVLLPVYASAFGMTIEQIVAFGTAINSHVNSLWSFIFICVVPFNIIKAALISSVVVLIYKRVSPVIKAKDANYEE